MGQVSSPQVPPSILLTATDRLVAVNADGGVGPGVSHIILLGQNAGRNDAASDVIGLGENSLGGAGPGLSSIALNGSIAIGSGALANIEGPGAGATATAAIVAIGRNAEGAAHFANSNVVVGDGALALNVPDTGQPTERMVVIGANAGLDIATAGIGVQTQRSVLIGYNVARPAAGSTSRGVFTSVIIGDSAGSGFIFGGNNGLSGLVLIGDGAGIGVDSSAIDSIAIGRGSSLGLSSTGCVAIGSTASTGGIARAGQIAIGRAASTGAVGAIAIGDNASVTANCDRSIAIGFSAIIPVNSDSSIVIGNNNTPLNGARNILLGAFVGDSEPAANADRFIIETVVASVRRGVLYGDMNAGNLIVGKSTPAVDRDLPGTNILKLLNGTATGNPVGGGMFFVTAGLLSWRDAAGVTYGLTPAGQLASRSVAFTNNAAAALGTLANAPVAGNPTKWIPVNDNGTIRNIPAW